MGPEVVGHDVTLWGLMFWGRTTVTVIERLILLYILAMKLNIELTVRHRLREYDLIEMVKPDTTIYGKSALLLNLNET